MIGRLVVRPALSAQHHSSRLQAEQHHDAQVELPLGATEDRICGTIDIEKALQEGIKAYEPGLLVRVPCWCVTVCIASACRQYGSTSGRRPSAPLQTSAVPAL